MAYKAPIWKDGKSPAISAENLNNLSQAAEGAQVLCGNSVPTPSTEGAVGQFYLVVVPDSDGNYPLYQCVAIANGSYTWRDTRRIPDSITSMLGIPAPGTINRALNVLANVGNLHVWERVQSGVTDYLTSTDRNAYPDKIAEGGQDAYYSLGDAVSGSFKLSPGNNNSTSWNYATGITVGDNGAIILTNMTQITLSDNKTVSNASVLKGKFVTPLGTVSSPFVNGKVYFIPSDATISKATNLLVNKYQPVTGHAAIPAKTTITYLGQLGGAARIETGSYVGTGTYGSDNPCSITLSKDPAIVFILQNGVFKGVLSKRASDAGGYSLTPTDAGSGYAYYSFLSLHVSASGNTISWYHDGQTDQLNAAGYTYTWVALAIG